MEVIARFVDVKTCETVVKGKGKDWEEALDKAFSKLYKLTKRPKVHIVWEFKV